MLQRDWKVTRTKIQKWKRTKSERDTYNTLDKGEIFRHHVLEVIGDKHTSHIHLNVVHFLAVVVEHIMGWLIRDEQNGFEGHLKVTRSITIHVYNTSKAVSLYQRIILRYLQYTRNNHPCTVHNVHHFVAIWRETLFHASKFITENQFILNHNVVHVRLLILYVICIRKIVIGRNKMHSLYSIIHVEQLAWVANIL